VLKVKVENESRLVRDMSSGAIINTDDSAHEAYLRQRENLLRSKQQLEQNSQDIQDLRGEISDIKQLLTQILANVQK
jgi:prefoldin subunit 5